jgi:hypothetical protein
LHFAKHKIIIDKNFNAICEKDIIDGQWTYCVNFYFGELIGGGITIQSLEECKALEKAFLHLKDLIVAETMNNKDPFK